MAVSPSLSRGSATPRRRSGTPALTCLCCALALSSGCVASERLGPRTDPADDGLSWFGPTAPADLRALARWRGSVGPAVVRPAPSSTPRPSSRLIVVSWNTHVGAGDIMGLLRELRTTADPDQPVVLLLQEVFRAGADVPRQLAPGASFASRLGVTKDPGRQDIVSIASAAGLHLYYAPSMRNGGLRSDEDRGNAILSSLPLSELAAIELPFERQRRVAIAATLTGQSSTGSAWTLRVVSAHLDNLAGLRRLWIAGSEAARARQARGLVAHLAGPTPTVLAGDFNTAFGFADRAYRETAEAFQTRPPADRRATFHGLLRLDHVFCRLPVGWTSHVVRADSRFGSDHSPLIATIQVGGPGH